MKFLKSSSPFPFSTAVIPPDGDSPVSGGVTAELTEIFPQPDEVLAEAGADKTAVVSVRLYLQDVLRDIVTMNQTYKACFGAHPPNRRAYGLTLQAGMLIEAAFVAELPE